MERETNKFSPELLLMMRDEERGKFLEALKNGASWSQLYQIRNTIRKLNDMIEATNGSTPNPILPGASSRGEEENPRSATSRA